MKTDQTIVTVMKPDGTYTITTVPEGYDIEIRQDGTVIMIDKTAEPEIGDDIAADLRNFECSCDSTACRACTAADEIDRLRSIVQELLPIALIDAENGVLRGPIEEGNEFCKPCEETCIDCEWYNESAAFMERYNSGYYS